MTYQVVPHSLFSEFDIHLFREGKHFKLYEKMGSHKVEIDGKTGIYFAVWAPNAKQVSVIGDFNNWDSRVSELQNPLGWFWDLGRFYRRLRFWCDL